MSLADLQVIHSWPGPHSPVLPLQKGPAGHFPSTVLPPTEKGALLTEQPVHCVG